MDGTWTDLTGQGGLNPLFVSAWPKVNLNLQANSPAIDSGDNELCPEYDYLGNPRSVDGNGDGENVCDIGAFEWDEQ